MKDIELLSTLKSLYRQTPHEVLLSRHPVPHWCRISVDVHAEISDECSQTLLPTFKKKKKKEERRKAVLLTTQGGGLILLSFAEWKRRGSRKIQECRWIPRSPARYIGSAALFGASAVSATGRRRGAAGPAHFSPQRCGAVGGR